MAFGFGFNKQKVLGAAEKAVQQGKLQNAISEYEKVVKADPKDLTVMNTVGDLYARLGNTDKAVEYFKNVGDAYASQGFTVKAIAMYKKLTKLRSSLESVLRLAELYTQQGLFNDARAQYLQVAEEFLKDNQLDQAVRIFQKTLEMDPENVAMRTRLAEVYLRLGKNQEAWQIFSAVAESLRSRGQLSAADEILRRMLQLDAGNSQALLLRGKNAFESGDIPGAAQQLEKVADLDNHPDGMKTLLQAYLQLGDVAQAGTLAEKLLTVHNDAGSFLAYTDALLAQSQFEKVLQLYQQHADGFLAGNSEKALANLHMMIGHVRENTPALEILLDLLVKAGETTHLTEIYELLAHAYVQSGDLQKAQNYYLKLTQLEPENPLHAQNYQQVTGKLGALNASRGISVQEGVAIVEELEATAPFIEQRYDDDIELAVRAALTDAELFGSYNMPAKALGPLMLALPRAPRDLRINQRLVVLFARAGQFSEAAACCRTLESVYHDAGCPTEAARYNQLAVKYEENVALGRAPAGVEGSDFASVQEAPASPVPELAVSGEAAEAPLEAAASEMPVEPDPLPAKEAAPVEARAGLFFHAARPQVAPEVPLQPVPLEAQEAVPEQPLPMQTAAEQPAAVQPEKEIDLSAEWEDTLAEEPASAAPAEEEAEAAAAPVQAQASASDAQTQSDLIEEIRFYLDQNMVEEARAAFGQLEALKPKPYVLDGIRDAIEAAVAKAPAAQPEAEAVPVEQPPAWGEGDAPEAAADEPATGEVPALEISHSEAEPEAVEVASAAAEQPEKPGLDQFVSDLEASLGKDFLPEVSAPAEAEPEPETASWSPSAPPEPMPVMLPMAAPPVEPLLGISASAPAAAAAAAAPAMEPETAQPAPLFTYQPSKQRQLGEPAAPAGVSAARVDLMGMFGELKQELEQDQAAGDDDLETHYNLGVGFREMGLLEEAIGEFQKVCQSVDRGNVFPQILQTYTWLAQCFLDKGMPEAAVRWYEKALKLPGIDEDAQTALHYELASAHELAGNKPAALSHFTEVYASNIDYRSVAERIQALKS